jgi:hypothetical protein
MGLKFSSGILNGNHQLSLPYQEVVRETVYEAHCKCVYQVKVINFGNDSVSKPSN